MAAVCCRHEKTAQKSQAGHRKVKLSKKIDPFMAGLIERKNRPIFF
jgi:hypothetical protein